jgi:Tol biopolymer transport system component
MLGAALALVISVSPAPSSHVFSYACIGGDGISHICISDLTRGGTQQLTSGTCSDEAPEWSFDGLKLAFERDCGNDHEIYKINADGTGIAQVTNSTVAFIPTWTPAGQIVYMQEVFQDGPVFCSNNYNAPCTDLRIINADGTGDTELLASAYTTTGAVSLINISPHVTPDGATVMFACGPYGSGSWGGSGIQLCSIPLATGNVTQVPTLLSSVSSVVSSDPHIGLAKVGGQYQVVFDSTRNGGLNLFTMSADGSAMTQLTSFVEPIEGQDAGFSPDMTEIIFEHDVNGGAASVWMMNADGSNQHDTGIACNNNGCKPRFRPY